MTERGMMGRAIWTLSGTALLGLIFGGAIGWAIGAVAPATYMSDIFGANSYSEAREMGIGFGMINGSIIGVVIGGLALLYDFGHRFLSTRETKSPPNS